MRTWHFPAVCLTYDTLSSYTDLKVDARMKRFTLPQIADIVRVHVLRDQGGVWLDADTIMLGDALPEEEMIGIPEARTNTIGFLRTEKGSAMYHAWAEHQDDIINGPARPLLWSAFGNDFTDPYVREHKEIRITDVTPCWPETYRIKGARSRSMAYQIFYFAREYHLTDVKPAPMLMLHNSWTPEFFKALTAEEVLESRCTLSNILKEVLA